MSNSNKDGLKQTLKRKENTLLWKSEGFCVQPKQVNRPSAQLLDFICETVLWAGGPKCFISFFHPVKSSSSLFL